MSELTKKMERIFNLSADERRVLDGVCTDTRDLEGRQDIIQAGDRPWQSNLLLEGMVCRYRTLSGGRRQILAFQYPGDVFDAYSFILETMDHSIGTLMPSKIALIPHEAMLELTERHARIARALWKDTLIDASVFAQWMTNIREKEPHAHIAHLICEIFVRLEAVELAKDGTITWPITPDDLSDALGVAVDYVRVILREFQARGWITQVQGRLIVHDLDILKREAGFDPTYLHYDPPRGPAGRAADWVKPL